MTKCKCDGCIRWRYNLGGYMPCVKAPPTTEYIDGKGKESEKLNVFLEIYFYVLCFSAGLVAGTLL